MDPELLQTVANPGDTYIAHVYLVYAAVGIGLTIWLARTLFKSGQAFLKDVFLDRPDLAESVNRLLVVGFYLFNFGYACFLLEGGYAADARGAIETLASKLGLLLMTLAVMHFVNLFIFHRIRRRGVIAKMGPPVRGRTVRAEMHHQPTPAVG